MSVHFASLLLGGILLWFPRQWMRLGKVIGGRERRRSGVVEPWRQREPGDPHLSFSEFRKARNYFDFLRAAAGGLAILGSHVIEPALVAARGDRQHALQALAIELAIVVIGTLIQVIRYERRRVSFYAPIFYLAGLSVALCGPWPALFAFILVWALNAMLGNAEAFLTMYGVVLAAFGYFFMDVPRILPSVALGLCLVPVLLALLARKPLVVFTRKPVSVMRDQP